MTPEEVMELIQGDTLMATELYEELTREEVEKLLDLYNCIDDLLRDVSDGFDVSLSQLRDLQRKMWYLRDTFKFKPQRDEDTGYPEHWKPYVLKDDPRAWYYKGETE